MKVTAVNQAYWRQIKEGWRFYANLGAERQYEVKWLAQQEVAEGQLTPERYEELIGEPYAAEESDI
jgi:hypothetical protein